MKPHRPFLELAAMAIDYPLTTPERRHLDEHLADCQACVRAAAALRADAAAVGSLSKITLSERRGDLILAAALHPVAPGHPFRLVAIAAVLSLLIIGSIAAGALLLQRQDDDLSVVVPVPSVSTTAPPSGGPTASPSPNATPVAVPTGVLAVTRGDNETDTWVELVTLETGAGSPLGFGADPAWFGDGRLVYACAKEVGQNRTICMVDPNEDLQPEIVSGASEPMPAPDGSLIAVQRGTVDVGETWLVRPDGTDLHKLATGSFRHWSPDGAWLAGQPESSTYEVAIIGAGGEGLRTLAPGLDPAWSPSGDRIAYVLFDDQGAASLRTVDVATGDVTVLYIEPAGVELRMPAWLGDRGWLFVRDGNVWRLDAGAKVPVQLTTGLAIDPSSSGGPFAISPDGVWAAFTTGIGAAARVGIVAVDGGTPVTYVGSDLGMDPAWAPASKLVSPDPSQPAPGDGASLGTVWTGASIPPVPGRPEGSVEAVTAGGPGFVAVGQGCDTSGDQDACEMIVWTSTDGSTWQRAPASDATDTRTTYSTSGPRLGMFDVTAGAPGIVAIGYAARPNLQATIWFSPDGSSWERIPIGLAGSDTDPGAFLATRVDGVTWDGRSFIAVGADRSNFTGGNLAGAKARAAVWTSPDGRAWTRVPHVAAFDVGGFVDTGEDPSSGGIHDVVNGPSGLVAIGTVCTNKPAGCQPAAWTSVDGASWERAADMPPVPGWPAAVAATDTGYVAVGGGLVLTSPDGRAWTSRPDPGGDLRTVTTIGEWLYASSPGPVTLWTSDDGSTWAPATHDGGPATEGGGPGEWRLAASPDVAVWLGRDAESDAPAAWVSETGQK